MKDEYKDIAKRYDKQLEDKLTREMYKEWKNELEIAIKKYGLKREVLIDLGCGTGITTTPWIDKFKIVIGVELSKPMLEIAKRKSSKIKWMNQNLVNLNIKEKADAVTCHFDVLNHILVKNDLQKALNKVYDVLKDNGVFIFDVITPESEEWLKKMGKRDNFSERAYPREELKSMLIKSGFNNIKIRKQKTPEWNGKPNRLIFLVQKA